MADAHVKTVARERNNLGTLRMVGALAVLFGHSYPLTLGLQTRDPLSDITREVVPYNLGLPGVGVAMFFAISGYLVTRSFVSRRSLVAYAEARVLRIYPALIWAVALTLVLGLVVSSYGLSYATSRETLAYAVHGSTLIDIRYTLPGVFETNPVDGVNGSLWTLPVELRMYGFVAIAGVLGILGRRTLFNLFALALVVVTLAWPDSPLLVHAEHVRAAIFFLAGAAIYINRDLIPLRPQGAAIAVVAAAAAALTPAYPLVFAVCFAYVVLWIGFDLRVRLPDLSAHGDLSYGTYLYAFPVAQFWVWLLEPGSPWIVAVLTLLAVLPLAWFSWHVVEEPALRRKGTVQRWLRSNAKTRLPALVSRGSDER